MLPRITKGINISLIDFAFLLMAIVFVSLAVVGGVLNYSPVPFWDMWDGYLEFYSKVASGDISSWWAQHNEHRIFLSRILFWIDIRFFHGASWFLIGFNYVLLTVCCTTFLFIFREISAKERSGKYIYFFLIAWVFSWIQAENLTWAFQSQFFLSLLMPLLGFYFLYKSIRFSGHPNTYFILAITFGGLSIASMANGILVLPLMVIYACLIRFKLKKILMLLGSSIVCTLLFLFNYRLISGELSPLGLLMNSSFGLIEYILSFIGGPFFYAVGGSGVAKLFAIMAGAIYIITYIVLSILILKNPSKNSRSLFLIFYITFLLLSILAIAFGRFSFGLNTAMSSRYMTTALFSWVALLLTFYSYFDSRYSKISTNIWLPCFMVLLMLFPCQLRALQENQFELRERYLAAIALDLGIHDQEQVAHIFPSVDWASSIVNIPLVRNISIFRYGETHALVTKLGVHYENSLQPSPCLGALDVIVRPGGESKYFKIQGWIFDEVGRRVPSEILILGKGNEVIGVGLTGFNRSDVARAIDPEAIKAGFKGYMLKADSSQSVVKVIDPITGCGFFSALKVIKVE